MGQPVCNSNGLRLIDELMSVAEQRQGAGAGLAEGAPPAAAPAGGTTVRPDAPEGQE